jgi:NAD(P)-dependent dehydrogenase (short-subunit alcohol dehydrogenase family)
MDVSNLSGATALVTGSASGIGRETALALARRGADLILCDVDEEGLAETEERIRAIGPRVLASAVDVSSREEMRAFADRVHGEVEAVDLLVNNAGVGLGATFLDTGLEDWDWIVGINLMGVVHGCHFFIPNMVQRGRGGHVVNISSAAALLASQILSAYATTKFAVLGLSEALREELAPHGIGVTAVCPGVIDTKITRSSPMRGALATDAVREQIVNAYRRRNYTAARVARNILKAVQRNRAVAPISPESWAFYYVKRLAPWLAARVGPLMARQGRIGSGTGASQSPPA